MTIYDQALAVLEAARRPGEHRIHPHDAVEALEQAGLLAPDLPERSRGMGTSGAVWYLPYHIGDIRRTGKHIVAFGHDCQDKPFRLVLTETETETIAHTLLAAANYKEITK